MNRCQKCNAIYPDTDAHCPSCGHVNSADYKEDIPAEAVTVDPAPVMRVVGVIAILIGLFMMPLGIILIVVGLVLILSSRLVQPVTQVPADSVSRPQALASTSFSTEGVRKDCFSHYYDKDSPFYGSDLIESSDTPFVCSECAKYTKRWFSEFGMNPNYPKLPDYFKKHLKEHEHCAISFFPVLDNISIPAWDYNGDLKKFCNRPFVDGRTAEQKENFNNYVREIQRKADTRNEYEWLIKNLPDVAPKSLSGYSRMKNLNSNTYIKLKDLAREKGRELG